MRERMNICAALTALAICGCHPDPTCTPSAAAAREARCVRDAVQECSLNRWDDERCWDEMNDRCDFAAQEHENRCAR